MIETATNESNECSDHEEDASNDEWDDAGGGNGIVQVSIVLYTPRCHARQDTTR